jgi:hypothetical protein
MTGKEADAMLPRRSTPGRTLVLFNYDWDQAGFARMAQAFPCDSAGFDLFTFPSNAQLAWFDIERFVDRLARRAGRMGWQAVVSNHEQFGALAAAMLAERMGWPGTPVAAVLACQHKQYARQVLQQVCPEANLPFTVLDAAYGAPIPEGLDYPLFVKPVKAAFSVLACTVRSRQALQAHTSFGAWELWVIRHLVEPFERVAKKRLPQAGTAHRLLLEQPVAGAQYNLDGYAFNGQVSAIGVVQAHMYPGTEAFMRFDYPCALAPEVQQQALEVARKFLGAVGFTDGLFNMEFFRDAASGKLTVIEFNPRMAPQFSDLYLRVDGVDLHHMALEMAWGRDPGLLARAAPTAGAASSFVYRIFNPAQPVAMPQNGQREAFAMAFPDGMLFEFPKTRGSMKRDFKWLGSYRYAIIHLGGADPQDLRQRCEQASAMFGWTPPFADLVPDRMAEPRRADPAPIDPAPYPMEISP